MGGHNHCRHAQRRARGLCRRIWQSQVRELRQDQQLWVAAVAADRATAEAVHTLLSILDGSEHSLKAATRTWLELMAAQALHKFPGACLEDSKLELDALLHAACAGAAGAALCLRSG